MSPIQPKRSSRCGQSLGELIRLARWVQRMFCMSWFSDGSEHSKRPTTGEVEWNTRPSTALADGRLRQAGQLHVAEAVVGEARLEDELAVRARRVAVHLRRAAQVGGVERAVVVEHLGVAEGDGLAGGAGGFHAAPAHHVLAEIEHEHAGLRLGHLDGREFLDDPDRFVALPDQTAVNRARNSAPAATTTRRSRARPSPAFPCGRHRLRRRKCRRSGWGRRWCSSPGAVGDNRLRLAVGEFDFELEQEARMRAVGEAAHGHQPACIPALAQQGGHGVLALAQQRGDIVGLVMNALAVAGPFRREQLLADALAVQAKFVEAQRAGVGGGALDGTVQLERLADHRGRQRPAAAAGLHRRQHAVGQVGLGPRAGFDRVEREDFGPLRQIAFAVQDLHLRQREGEVVAVPPAQTRDREPDETRRAWTRSDGAARWCRDSARRWRCGRPALARRRNRRATRPRS